MKTKEELNALKEEVETLNKKLAELSEDELKLVVGGVAPFEQFSGNLIGGVDELARLSRHNIRSPLAEGAD